MSVMVSELREDLLSLKDDYDGFTSFTHILFQQLQKSMQHDLHLLVDHLMAEISTKNQLISQLKEQLDKANLKSTNRIDELTHQHSKQYQDKVYYRQLAEENALKYEQALESNRRCEQEFLNLMEEMQEIKGYLNQFKAMKEKDQTLTKEPEDEEVILHKMESLQNLEKRTSQALLDTIKEVTEKSVHSQTESQEIISEFSNTVGNKTQSFQCISEVYDINKIIFDQSRGKENQSQSYLQSLNFLKNYGSPSDTNQQEFKLMLPPTNQFKTPKLVPQNIISHQELVFEDGYTYHGKTIQAINMGYLQLKPMGFGQLFLHGSLLYCGEWKNGLYHGWGKIAFDHSNLKEFSGKLESGIPEGPGKLKFTDESQFVGHFSQGEANGEGTYKTRDSVRWGSWRKNVLVQQS